VTALVEQEWPEHAPWWVWVAIVLGSVFIASFLAWREIRKDEKKLQDEIVDFKTPNISVDFLELRSKHGLGQLLITIKNLSRNPIRAEVWCTSYQVTKKDEGEGIHSLLEINYFVANAFTITSEEPHEPSVIEFYEKHMFGPIKVVAPYKISDNIEILNVLMEMNLMWHLRFLEA
jgi:GNAT superfamily N-acetyltransferase